MSAKSAAVLIGILDKEIILTRRAADLRSFTGQVCLPGGKFDSVDIDFSATAQREFREEVYFAGQIEPLFSLFPECSVVSRQKVYPLVAKLNGEILGVNPSEVGRLFYLPLDILQPELFSINPEYPNIQHNLCFNYDNEFVWGLTAYILYHFSLYHKKNFESL